MENSKVNTIVRKYIGIPFRDHGAGFDGCDCYGLVCLLYREEFGLYLPQVGDLYDTAYNRHRVDSLLTSETRGLPWCMDVTGQGYQPFDMLVFRIAGTDHHVGLYVREGIMLHVIEGASAGLEHYDGVRWGRQLHRVLRHRDHADR